MFKLLSDLKTNTNYIVCEIPTNRLIILISDSEKYLNSLNIISNNVKQGPNSRYKLTNATDYSGIWYVDLTKLLSFAYEDILKDKFYSLCGLVQKQGGFINVQI